MGNLSALPITTRTVDALQLGATNTCKAQRTAHEFQGNSPDGDIKIH